MTQMCRCSAHCWRVYEVSFAERKRSIALATKSESLQDNGSLEYYRQFLAEREVECALWETQLGWLRWQQGKALTLAKMQCAKEKLKWSDWHKANGFDHNMVSRCMRIYEKISDTQARKLPYATMLDMIAKEPKTEDSTGEAPTEPKKKTKTTKKHGVTFAASSEIQSLENMAAHLTALLRDDVPRSGNVDTVTALYQEMIVRLLNIRDLSIDVIKRFEGFVSIGQQFITSDKKEAA